MTTAGPFRRAYRVRFDEAGADGLLRPSGYLRYAQDVAWQHSQAAGYDRAWYTKRQSHWLVRSTELRLLRPVAYGATLDVSTEVVGWRRVLARRHTRFLDEASVVCAEAETDWALLGPSGRPASVPREIADAFAPGATFAPLRVDVGLPPVGAPTESLTVRDADVDPMGHLNNAAYLDLVDAGLAGSDVPAQRAYRVVYLRPALVGADLVLATWPIGTRRIACTIRSSDGELCRAIVAWTGAA